MFNRFLRYLIVWAAILAVLCILSIIKYRQVIFDSVGGMISEIAIVVIIGGGIIYALSAVFRR